ncbi:HIRAN domain-containing protein [Falsihalocynthiibacter sp. S25ZX9]|uniref:HIRAN domain-containing protein n=1 Tax=Falsihalocynthiibacter sp. S25ZX9 TaxID=3240870 RepID=UPI00350F0388
MKFLKALFGGRSSGNKSSKATLPKVNDLKPSIKKASSKARPLKAHVVTDLKSFPFNVVGEINYQDALEEIASGYRRDSQAFPTNAIMVLDPENRFDPNAVRVEIDRQTIGYLPREEAKRIGGMMRDQGVTAVTVEAQIRGGWRTNQHDQGHFGVRLKIPQSGWIDFGVGSQKPESMPAVPRTKNPAIIPAIDGPLSKEKIKLWGFPKDGEEAKTIAQAGGQVMASVGKSTTIVVMDNGPITPGMKNSSTWKKMENLRETGQNIELVTWSEIQSRIAIT